MACRSLASPAKGIIAHVSRRETAIESMARTFAPGLTRTLATEAAIPTPADAYASAHVAASSSPLSTRKVNRTIPPHILPPTVLTTVYSFPTMEPLRFEPYPTTHLGLPLRRDILHRAIVFEGDATRSGTASTKWRDEVHGSTRKIRPQKGTGRARLGDKKSPMLRGGGVAFGPKPRDFSTELPRKMYDLAWRTALSHRYRMGELVVVNNGIKFTEDLTPKAAIELFMENGWSGKANKGSMVITESPNSSVQTLISKMGTNAGWKAVRDVDVKNLLEMGRLIMEKAALDRILKEHQTDLTGR